MGALFKHHFTSMIISHKHRFIFFAIPKTGTHTVRQALREHLGPNDLEQVGLFIQKKFSFPELEDFKSGHVSAMQIRPVLGNDIFDNYFKFAFVRNPHDRFVSYCAFMSRFTGEFISQPKAFMMNVITKLNPVNHLLYKPQYEFIVDQNEEIIIDYIGRNETMQASYEQICQKIGIPSTELNFINGTKHRPFMEYYDEETFALVSNLYRKDIEFFDYRN